jgi:hypothetical protein
MVGASAVVQSLAKSVLRLQTAATPVYRRNMLGAAEAVASSIARSALRLQTIATSVRRRVCLGLQR